VPAPRNRPPRRCLTTAGRGRRAQLRPPSGPGGLRSGQSDGKRRLNAPCLSRRPLWARIRRDSPECLPAGTPLPYPFGDARNAAKAPPSPAAPDNEGGAPGDDAGPAPAPPEGAPGPDAPGQGAAPAQGGVGGNPAPETPGEGARRGHLGVFTDSGVLVCLVPQQDFRRAPSAPSPPRPPAPPEAPPATTLHIPPPPTRRRLPRHFRVGKVRSTTRGGAGGGVSAVTIRATEGYPRPAAAPPGGTGDEGRGAGAKQPARPWDGDEDAEVSALRLKRACFRDVAADAGVREALRDPRARAVVGALDAAETGEAEELLWGRMEDCGPFRELAHRMLEVVEASGEA